MTKAGYFLSSLCVMASPLWAGCDLSDLAFYERQDRAELAACIAAGQDFAAPVTPKELGASEPPLALALWLGSDVEFVQMLWDAAARHAPPDQLMADGLTPLHWLALNENAPVRNHFLRPMLAAGMDPSLPYGTLLGQDLDAAGISIPERMLWGGKLTDPELATALMQACVAGAAFDPGSAAAEKVLDSAATWLPGPEAVEILLAAGVDANARSKSGWTPLLHFSNRNLKSTAPENRILEALLAHGADPRATNDDGETALHRIAQSSNVAGAKLLVAAGADPLARDAKGATALHQHAQNWPKPEMTRYLLELGIDPRQPDAAGLRAIDYQLRRAEGDQFRVPEVIAILEAAAR